jgi:hypothetical protein
VGLLRLGQSLVGLPNSITVWFSISAVMIVARVVFSIRVHTTGFGGYRYLFVLFALELLVGETIIAGGIMLTATTGVESIFSAPEFGSDISYTAHAMSHLIGGPTLQAFFFWIPGSAILFVTRMLVKVQPAP